MTKFSRVDILVFLVALAGALAIGQAASAVRLSSIDPVMLGILIALAAVSQRVQVVVFRSSAISVSIAAVIAGYVLFGAPVAVLLSLVEAAVNAFTPHRKPLVKVAFNTGNLATSAYAAAAVYALAGGVVRPTDIIATLIAVAASAAAYFLVNTTLAATVIALSEHRSVVAVWRTSYSWMPVNFLATAAQGAALAMASQALGVFGALVFTLPLAVAWYSFRLYTAKSIALSARDTELRSVSETLRQTTDRLDRSDRSVIGALMGALEVRATTNAEAAAEAVRYAMRVAERLGCSADEIATIKLGTLFHDIGTIAISRDLLAKTAPLDDAEREQLEAHTTIGASLVANIPMLERIRPIVLSHHEHHDGSGYPRGLRKDEIPLAAQIVAVAGAYQSMTQKRARRGAFTPKQALRELRASAGTHYNPIVVEAFITVVVDERRKALRGATRTEPAFQQALEAVRATQ